MAPKKIDDQIKSSGPHRIYALYILSVLKAHSDEKKPMTIKDIQKAMEDTFFQAHTEKAPDVKTIRNQLVDIMASLNAKDAFSPDSTELNTSFRLGFHIHRCIKISEDKYQDFDPDKEEETSDNSKTSKSKTQYFYYKSIFDDSEISLLIHSLEACNYLSANDIAGLVVKLSNLNPRSMKPYHNKKYHMTPDPRLENNHACLLDNLRILYQIIRDKKFALIANAYFNENHELQPLEPPIDPSISKLLPCKTVRPLQLIYNNGYYYLIARQYSTSKDKYFTVHYRIDRLIYVEEYDPTPEERTNYEAELPGDPAYYRLQHPVMYGDDLANIHMLVTNHPRMLNVLMDIFGPVATIQIKDEKWLEVNVRASIGGMQLIATEYCADIRVLSPEPLVKRIKDDLIKSLSLYDEQLD